MTKFVKCRDADNAWTYGKFDGPMYVEAEIYQKRLIIKMWENGQHNATADLPMDPEGPSYAWTDKRCLQTRFSFLDLLRELPPAADPFKESLAKWRTLVITNYRCEMLVNAIRKTAEKRPELLDLIARILHGIFGHAKFNEALGEVLKALTKKS